MASSRVVHAVVRAGCGRERTDRPLGVVGDRRHVGREERLVVGMYLRGNVCPPQERLRFIATVEEADLELDDRGIRSQPNAVHTLHPVERVVVGAPDRAIGRVDIPRRRQKRCRAVVLRPVELHATGEPGSSQPHQGWLDHRIRKEQRVACPLVHRKLNPATELRQDQQPDVSVLQVQPEPPTGLARLTDPVVERQREDPTRRSLIDPPVQVRRIAARLLRHVGGENDGVAPDSDRQIRHLGWTSWEIEDAARHKPKLGRRPMPQECTIRRSTWTIL